MAATFASWSVVFGGDLGDFGEDLDPADWAVGGGGGGALGRTQRLDGGSRAAEDHGKT